MPAEVIETIFEVIEGGASVEGATILEFPTDVVVGETLSGTTTSVTLGNGVATEVSQLTVETAAGATETAGVGLLAIDVGVAGAAAAPILGILAGVGLYNLAPDFWTSVADKLWEAGETVGGKVRAYLNPKTKQVGLSQTTLDIFAKAFLEAGIYDNKIIDNISQNYTIQYINEWDSGNNYSNMSITPNWYNAFEYFHIDQWYSRYNNVVRYFAFGLSTTNSHNQEDPNFDVIIPYKSFLLILNNNQWYGAYDYTQYFLQGYKYVFLIGFNESTNKYSVNSLQKSSKIKYGEIERYILLHTGSGIYDNPVSQYDKHLSWSSGYRPNYPPLWKLAIATLSENLQPNAIYPTLDKTIPETYPTYTPWELPENLPAPAIYPVEIPVVNPNPNQQEAQNPEPLPDNQPVADWLIDNLPQPNPNPDPPSEGGDVDPPDPPDPNPEPTPGPSPIVPDMPESVNAHKMFTVYNPTDSQLNDFGGWLWTSNIIENIVKIWAGDPIQGILSLRKVYAKPVTGSMKNIVVGYLDSGVDALEVSNQFVTIECGTVQVAEQKHNATDYPPYTSLHLYLPFIGVVELDPNEFMNGSITVTYHVDVYTGSCLAEVKATRAADMPNATILYTFTGNASQELPLSSSNFSGAISSLVSLATAGIAVASGGGLIAAGATASAVHSLTHEMIHINRSGNLSSNAGIMGSRIPYLIIGMRHGYDANAYNELYGYPANKTVYLGNCKGYTRIKAGRLRTKATEAEKKEIMQLCEKGIIL